MMFRYYLCAAGGMLIFHTTVAAESQHDALREGRSAYDIECALGARAQEPLGLEWAIPEDTMAVTGEIEVPDPEDYPVPCMRCGAPVSPLRGPYCLTCA